MSRLYDKSSFVNSCHTVCFCEKVRGMETVQTLRTNEWLRDQLQNLLGGPFSDMELANVITIEFGRKARRRLGSIRMSRDKKQSHILINGFLRDPEVPEQIISSVVAHELCHYAHGFCSPLPKKYSSPHAGGIIGRELKKRGLYLLLEYEKQWTKSHWPRIANRIRPIQRRRGGFKRGLLQELVKFLQP